MYAAAQVINFGEALNFVYGRWRVDAGMTWGSVNTKQDAQNCANASCNSCKSRLDPVAVPSALVS